MVLSRTEEASSETLVGEDLAGDEEVVTAVSLFNIDAVQLIPETFYHNYQELLTGGVAEDDFNKPTNVPVLQYPSQHRCRLIANLHRPTRHNSTVELRVALKSCFWLNLFPVPVT